MSKKLVAYFSATGTTKRVAERLAKAAGADLFEIVPAEPYTSADLDWLNKKSRNVLERDDEASRPAIVGKVKNMADYDTIYLGFPIWWYIAPRIIYTFVESYNLAGKKIVPFATSGGSGMGRTVDDLQRICPEANWQPGKVLNGFSDSKLEDWAKSY